MDQQARALASKYNYLCLILGAPMETEEGTDSTMSLSVTLSLSPTYDDDNNDNDGEFNEILFGAITDKPVLLSFLFGAWEGWRCSSRHTH